MIDIPLHRQHESCFVSPEISRNIIPTPVHDKFVSRFEGYLRYYDGQYFLDSEKLHEGGHAKGGSTAKQDVWGAPNWERIYAALLNLVTFHFSSSSFTLLFLIYVILTNV